VVAVAIAGIRHFEKAFPTDRDASGAFPPPVAGLAAATPREALFAKCHRSQLESGSNETDGIL